MATEIERKFLVASDAWRAEADQSSRLRQAIVFADGDRSLRIRIWDGKRARLTIKVGINAMARHEFEYDVPLADGEDLLRLAKGSVIAKTRHEVAFGGHLWEIDCYDGALAGLVIAEVELEHEAVEPPMPAWLGREVTGDRRFANQALAEGSLGENWRDEIHP